RCNRVAPVPLRTKTQPTFRPTTASFSPVTLSPTPPSSANDLSLLRKGTHNAKCQLEVHPQGFRDVRHLRGGPPLEVRGDRDPRRLGRPRFRDDDPGFLQFVHVGFDRSFDELGARAHSRPPHEPVDFFENPAGRRSTLGPGGGLDRGESRTLFAGYGPSQGLAVRHGGGYPSPLLGITDKSLEGKTKIAGLHMRLPSVRPPERRPINADRAASHHRPPTLDRAPPGRALRGLPSSQLGALRG